jgi:hypothetical protein
MANSAMSLEILAESAQLISPPSSQNSRRSCLKVNNSKDESDHQMNVG